MRPPILILLTPLFVALGLCVSPSSLPAADGNRLAYLDKPLDPYYVHREFPKLTTPQWVGEEGVQAVVILAIDDMRDTAKYEDYLRPILQRLKQIDGRAPVSIMTCKTSADDPQLERWLHEGLSIEVHTVDHPCPLLKDGDFDKAKSTYERGIDMMASIPGNNPVAFRMPCCDSLNTPSPRFFTEIFNDTTSAGNFLAIDSSVFNITTSADPDLPHALTKDADGRDRFRKYLPFESFVNTIEDYPYPYIIGHTCWEFPCTVPSDWEAQNLQQPFNPKTVEDMKAALDAVVRKQGVFDLVFHPHGWIRNEQVIQLIDHAQQRHGNRVKFLTFREAHDRLNKHLLANRSLRETSGQPSGIRLLDINNDGHMDVFIPQADHEHVTRIWSSEDERWVDHKQTFYLERPRFGVVDESGRAALASVGRRDEGLEMRVFDGRRWSQILTVFQGDGQLWRSVKQTDAIRLRDLDGDGLCELLLTRGEASEIFGRTKRKATWRRLPFDLPPGTRIVDEASRDAGLRFVDVNQDGLDDCLFSNHQRYSLHLFNSRAEGWSIEAVAGDRTQTDNSTATAPGPEIPPIIRADGTSNGAWFHSDHLWIQNESTDRLPDLVDRLSFSGMLGPYRRSRKMSAPTRQIGAAKVNITPDYPVRLSGYGGRRQESEGVAQSIWAKAISISNHEGDQTAIMIMVENCGMTAAIREQVAERLRESAGVPAERLVISVTHTHTAPCLTDWAPYLFGEDIPPDHQQRIDQYTGELIEKLVEVAQAAIDSQREGRLYWATGEVDFAINRRVLQQNKWTQIGEQPDGPVDHRLPVLVAKDRYDQPIAIVANYACHATTLGGKFNQISGDWVGFASQMIESQQEGAVALVTIGCGADANPSPRGNAELAERHGRALADEVARLLQTDLEPIVGDLQCRLERIKLPFETLPTGEQFAEQAKLPGARGYHARRYAERLDSGEEVPSTLDYPIGTWVFGDDLAMVFLAGEAVVDYAIRSAREFAADRLWVTAYANEVPCYIPSRRVLREGGYEAEGSMVYYAQPTRLAPATEDLLIDSVQRLLPPRFYSDEKQLAFPPPQTPEQALQSFTVNPGLVVELVAAEPLVIDPVAFDWGPDGRLWVVEMSDYPNGMDGKGKPGGIVKVLDDDDGDGRYDRAKVFIDGLPFPTGVKVWRDGILITAAPDVIYAQDTDGDDVADQQQTLYRGFGEGNQQHRVNGLRWGLDGWLYAGNGDSDGVIKSLKADLEVNVSGRDLRIQPDLGLIETQSGRTQFGRERDDFGNWFGGNNSNPMWHYVLEEPYLARNPHFAPPDVRKHVSDRPGAAPVYPTSRTLARFNDFDKTNRFTSACSPIIYQDRVLGDRFGTFSFVCEPVHNLVHREVVQAEGTSFTSTRHQIEQESEFFSSSDNWFRPVMVRSGPDGALYVADMYRFVIEHPKWVPMSWQRKMDVRAGDTMGRIYRVRMAGRPTKPFVRLDTLDTKALVKALDSQFRRQRDMAQQLLFWRKDPQTVEPLKQLINDPEWPRSSFHALYLLDELGALDEETLITEIKHRGPEIGRHAVRIGEGYLSQWAGVGPAMLSRTRSENGQLRMQVAYSLGEWDDPRASTALAQMALDYADDKYVVAAIASSLTDRNLPAVIGGILADQAEAESDKRVRNRKIDRSSMYRQLLTLSCAMGDRAVVSQSFAKVAGKANEAEAWQFETISRMMDRLRSRKGNGRALIDRPALEAIDRLVSVARQMIANHGQDPQTRSAVRFLSSLPKRSEEDLQSIVGLLQPQTPTSLQITAVEALKSFNVEQVGDRLLRQWSSFTPRIRSEILDLMLDRPGLSTQLLRAVRARQIPLQQIDVRRQARLQQHPDASVRALAAEVIKPTESNRGAVIEQYASAIATAGDAVRGREVYSKRCANCHQIGALGHVVGPDLLALTDKSPKSLLAAILDPNRAVEDKYLGYTIADEDGRVYSGIITDETGNSITLAAADGKRQTLLRNQIDQMQATGKSLMPEGLEKDMQPEDVRDVIAFVRGQRAAPKIMPGNQPQVAPRRDDGSIRLFAIHARIYGPSLVLEAKYRNLGYWRSTADRAEWTVEVPQAARYRVMLDYACDDEAAGNHFILTAAGQTITAKVAGSGSWDNYRRETIGTIDLPGGTSEVIVRSDGLIDSALFDLRTIRLTPVAN